MKLFYINEQSETLHDQVDEFTESMFSDKGELTDDYTNAKIQIQVLIAKAKEIYEDLKDHD